MRSDSGSAGGSSHRLLLSLLLSLAFLIHPAPLRAATDTAALGELLDRTVTRLQASDHVPGTAFVLVEDGAVRFARAWGLADVEAGTPFDPASTVLRMGSLTKVLTATAIMQLVEAGRLRLDDEVQPILGDVHPGGDWPEPVRVWNLITHTAGIDTRYYDILARDPAKFHPLDAYLRRMVPPRVEPPGSVIHYSDFGAALAGLVVERVGGTTYEGWVDGHIFAPLGMAHSHIVTSSDLEPGLASGYDWDGSKLVRLATPDFLPVTPAGAGSTTALDLSRLLLAWMGDGSFEGGSILAPATAALMRSTRFVDYPGFPGLCHGFLEYEKNGHRLVGHGGGILGQSTMVYFVPDAGLGYIIVANANEAFRYLCDIEQAFLDFRLPAPSTPPASDPPLSDPSTLEPYAGRYRGNRYPRSTFDAILAVALPIVPEQRVTVVDGRLVLDSVRFWVVPGGAVTLLPDGPDCFRRADGLGRVAFRLGPDGRAGHMFFSRNPVAVFDRIAFGDTAAAHALYLGGLTTIWIWALVVVGGAWRRGSLEISGWPRPYALILAVVAILGLVAPATPLAAMFPLEWKAPAHTFGIGWPMRLILGLPFLFALTVPILVVATSRLMLRPDGVPPLRRVQALLTALAALAAVHYLAGFSLLVSPP